MERVDQSSFDVATKIRCLMDMAMKSEISWTILESLFDELTPSIEKSKHVVKVLLKEFQALQSKLQKKISSDHVIENYTISQENDYGFVDQEDTFEVVEIVQEPTEELQDVKDETITLREKEASEFGNEVNVNELEELSSV